MFTSESSVHIFFHWVNLFSRVSGSKINYEKSKGLYLGKWKTRSDHPFGISWVKCHKILGYWFGEGIDPDESWSKCFSKFDKTLKLWLTRRLSLKGKSTVLNSLGISKVLYYATASELPSYYEILFQRSAFRFVWNSTYEPVSRDTLYLDFAKGGLNIPNFKLKCEVLLLSHLQKLFFNHNAYWTYFARYWIGLQHRKFNKTFACNSIPHSETIPKFYKSCLDILKRLTDKFPDFSFNVSFKSRTYYNMLLDLKKYQS